MHTLYEGAILAVIVVFLFLRDWRATVIAAITLPLSILPAFWVMNLLGFSLNIVSLLAITLSVGILVDDAIVEIENIVRHIHMGKSPYRAALEASDEIGLAVVAISLAIVAVFLPASFLTSVPGQFFKQFGITVSVQVLFSLLVARLITPMLAAYFLKPIRHVEKPDGIVTRGYTRLLTWAVRYRFVTVALGLILFVAAMASTRFLPSGFMPASDSSRSILALDLPPGSQLGDTEALTEMITKRVRGRRGGRKRLCRRRSNSAGCGRCRQSRSDNQLRSASQTVTLTETARTGDFAGFIGHSRCSVLVPRRQWAKKREIDRCRPGQCHGRKHSSRTRRSNSTTF